MEGEDPSVAPLTEEGAAQPPDLRGRFDPAGGLQAKLPQLLQSVVQFLCQKLHAHLPGLALRAPRRRILCSLFEGFLVIAETPAACRGLLRAVAEEELVRAGSIADHVRLSPAFLHAQEGGKGRFVFPQAAFHLLPAQIRVPPHIAVKPFFQFFQHLGPSFQSSPNAFSTRASVSSTLLLSSRRIAGKPERAKRA